MRVRISGILGVVFFFCVVFFSFGAWANDLKVTNVHLGSRDTNSKTIAVFFDLAWQNSWRNKINHDAAWVTVHLQDVTAASPEKKLCRLSINGLNPAGVSAGSNTELEIQIPSDKVGAFIRRTSNHMSSAVATTNVMLTVNYETAGLSAESQVTATVTAYEMVYVPRGMFYAGDYAASAAAFQRGGVDNNPWPITSESAINVSAASSNAYYYVSAGNNGEFASGSAFIIPATFPKGFEAFYMMKYEITEGQWVEFINSLSAPGRANHDVTNVSHKNADAVIDRNTIACAGSPLMCSSERPNRAMTFLSWPDLCAFLDWAGLRPITELEFEKAARGPYLPVNGEFAWGTTDIQPLTALSNSAEDGLESSNTNGANAHFGGTLISGGDAALGTAYRRGTLRGGIFATDSTDRILSGAGSYGAMELSGNAKEWAVSVGLSAGLVFTRANGDGVLTTASGFEGNADSISWPGLNMDVSRGITTTAGAGFRGGSWNDASTHLSISDRSEAASSSSDATSTYGGRGVRSAEGL